MKNLSFFNKLVIFGTIFALFPMIIMGSFSYIQSTNLVQERVSEERVETVRQIRTNIEQNLSMVDQSINVMVDSATMGQVIYSSMNAEDFILHREVRQELANVQTIHPLIEDYVIINFQYNWMMNERGSRIADQHPDIETYRELLSKGVQSWQLLNSTNFEEPLTKGSCPYTLSLVKSLPRMASEPRALVLIPMSVCELVKSLQGDISHQDLVIVNNDSQIIYHPDLALIGQDLEESGLVHSIEGITETSGFFETTNNGEVFTVSYAQANMNQWSYLMVHSVDELREESKSIALVMISLIIIVSVGSLLFILIASRYLYRPLKNVRSLIDEGSGDPNEYSNADRDDIKVIENRFKSLFSSKFIMESELDKHNKQAKTMFLTRMFIGDVDQQQLEENLTFFKMKKEHWRNHIVMTLEIDSISSSRFEFKDWDLITFSIVNILEEILAETEHFEPIWIQNTLVCLVSDDRADQEELEITLNQIAERLKDTIEKLTNIIVSIGLSMSYSDMRKSDRAYQEAIEALKHRIRLGKGVIIPYGHINEGKHSIMYSYPVKLEEDLLLSIKTADWEKTVTSFEDWMGKVFKQDHSLQDYQISMMRLLNNLILVYHENLIQIDQEHQQKEYYYEELFQLSDKKMIYEWFTEKLITPLYNEFLRKRDSQFKNLSEKMIDMIHEQYDQELTLEQCANQLHYNANYLSSVFKQETKHTFSEYLAMHRFKKAKEWLIKTDMPVKEIAERLQYNNSQNFIRSFKKYADMTPGQYRKENGI
ncbi:helix-turn-helix domain-containing protein [Salipaludibacillus sp. CF4.18]|uniref:helix-turn-helix domain-containing protein n=1 Tax=Salipaludibacillus sp. CF4.18 TaxID=3373081 RepID=UPI003EE6877A